VVLDPIAVRAIPLALAARLVADVGRRTRNRAVILTPRRTGLLASANRLVMQTTRTRVKATIENRTKYALYVHEGTRSHFIKARRPGGALRFRGRTGQWVFRRRVLHPGTKPRPWLTRSLYEIAEPEGFQVVSGTGGYLKSWT
jgi:hypothetical protein